MKKLKKSMIIDVNLGPALSSETGKIRPCVIVTNDAYNGCLTRGGFLPSPLKHVNSGDSIPN